MNVTIYTSEAVPAGYHSWAGRTLVCHPSARDELAERLRKEGHSPVLTVTRQERRAAERWIEKAGKRIAAARSRRKAVSDMQMLDHAVGAVQDFARDAATQ